MKKVMLCLIAVIAITCLYISSGRTTTSAQAQDTEHYKVVYFESGSGERQLASEKLQNELNDYYSKGWRLKQIAGLKDANVIGPNSMFIVLER